MDHGCFLVQMLGRSIAVPSNSPHTVMALSSCYVIGHTYTTQGKPYDLISVLADISAGVAPDGACKSRISQIRLGLQNDTCRKAFINHFVETWAADAPKLRVACGGRL
jgi:hypothetical protein